MPREPTGSVQNGPGPCEEFMCYESEVNFESGECPSGYVLRCSDF